MYWHRGLCDYSHYIHTEGGGKRANACSKTNSSDLFLVIARLTMQAPHVFTHRLSPQKQFSCMCWFVPGQYISVLVVVERSLSLTRSIAGLDIRCRLVFCGVGPTSLKPHPQLTPCWGENTVASKINTEQIPREFESVSVSVLTKLINSASTSVSVLWR